jgi:hypothetical protein
MTVELDGRNVVAEIENPANPLIVISTTRGDLLLDRVRHGATPFR